MFLTHAQPHIQAKKPSMVPDPEVDPGGCPVFDLPQSMYLYHPECLYPNPIYNFEKFWTGFMLIRLEASCKMGKGI